MDGLSITESAIQKWLQNCSVFETMYETGGGGPEPNASPQLDGLARDINKLQRLLENDRAQFRTIMDAIAEELEQATDFSSDGREAAMISCVAEAIRIAGKSGDLSRMRPNFSERCKTSPEIYSRGEKHWDLTLKMVFQIVNRALRNIPTIPVVSERLYPKE